MSYIIKIEQSTREQVKKREYVPIGTKNDETEYGYVNNETTEDVEREIYTQHVEELDLVAVIDAVNKANRLDTTPPVIVKGSN